FPLGPGRRTLMPSWSIMSLWSAAFAAAFGFGGGPAAGGAAGGAAGAWGVAGCWAITPTEKVNKPAAAAIPERVNSARTSALMDASFRSSRSPEPGPGVTAIVHDRQGDPERRQRSGRTYRGPNPSR